MYLCFTWESTVAILLDRISTSGKQLSRVLVVYWGFLLVSVLSPRVSWWHLVAYGVLVVSLWSDSGRGSRRGCHDPLFAHLR